LIGSIRRQPTKRYVPIPFDRKKPVFGGAASLVTHGALALGFLLATRNSDSVNQSGTPATPFQPVEMIYLTPRSNVVVTQPISRPPPDAVQAKDDQRALIRQPQPDAAPTIEPDAAQPPAPEPPPEEPPLENTMATAPETPEPEQPTMESEAQRIFGRPQLRRQEDNSTALGIRLGAISDREAAARRSCVPKPRDPHAQIEMAELVGRVWYDEAHTRPIPGAYLQIIGTSYSAYSDGNGRYRLVFDASLVDECRTQYVRVVATGYTGKNLVLGLGPGVNDVVMGR
jgi:hypothetical protein